MGMIKQELILVHTSMAMVQYDCMMHLEAVTPLSMFLPCSVPNKSIG